MSTQRWDGGDFSVAQPTDDFCFLSVWLGLTKISPIVSVVDCATQLLHITVLSKWGEGKEIFFEPKFTGDLQTPPNQSRPLDVFDRRLMTALPTIVIGSFCSGMVLSIEFASQSFGEILKSLMKAMEDMAEIRDCMRRMEFCMVAITVLVYTVSIVGLIVWGFYTCRRQMYRRRSDYSRDGSHESLPAQQQQLQTDYGRTSRKSPHSVLYRPAEVPREKDEEIMSHGEEIIWEISYQSTMVISGNHSDKTNQHCHTAALVSFGSLSNSDVNNSITRKTLEISSVWGVKVR